MHTCTDIARDDAGVPDIVGAIERYLNEHPNAADAIEGIRRWWITPERRDDTPARVQVALDLLVTCGRLSRTALADGTMVYARAGCPS
jgi:hypothetical protein